MDKCSVLLDCGCIPPNGQLVSSSYLEHEGLHRKGDVPAEAPTAQGYPSEKVFMMNRKQPGDFSDCPFRGCGSADI